MFDAFGFQVRGCKRHAPPLFSSNEYHWRPHRRMIAPNVFSSEQTSHKRLNSLDLMYPATCCGIKTFSRQQSSSYSFPSSKGMVRIDGKLARDTLSTEKSSLFPSKKRVLPKRASPRLLPDYADGFFRAGEFHVVGSSFESRETSTSRLSDGWKQFVAEKPSKPLRTFSEAETARERKKTIMDVENLFEWEESHGIAESDDED